MTAVLFENAHLFDGVAGELRPAHVLVEDGLIKEVSDTPVAAAKSLRIDVAGRTLMPDLIVVDGDPLQDVGVFHADGRNVPVVMKAGEFLKGRP